MFSVSTRTSRLIDYTFEQLDKDIQNINKIKIYTRVNVGSKELLESGEETCYKIVLS